MLFVHSGKGGYCWKDDENQLKTDNHQAVRFNFKIVNFEYTNYVLKNMRYQNWDGLYNISYFNEPQSMYISYSAIPFFLCYIMQSFLVDVWNSLSIIDCFRNNFQACCTRMCGRLFLWMNNTPFIFIFHCVDLWIAIFKCDSESIFLTSSPSSLLYTIE